MEHKPEEHRDHTHSPLHSHPRQGYRRVKTALFVGLTLAFVQGVGAVASGSLALLADTAHVIFDISTLLVTLFAGWLAARPLSKRRSFGYYRIEVLAALLNGVLLFGVALGIFYEAYQRFQSPRAVEGGTMLGIAIFGFLANLVMLVVIHPSKGENINLRAAYLHVLGDSLSSLAVIVSAGLILWTKLFWIDSAASCLVALMIASMAIRVISHSVHILLEGTPLHLEPSIVEASLKKAFPEIIHIHDFHIWEITSHLFALSAHIDVKLENLETYQKLLEDMTSHLRANFQIGHATLQIELKR